MLYCLCAGTDTSCAPIASRVASWLGSHPLAASSALDGSTRAVSLSPSTQPVSMPVAYVYICRAHSSQLRALRTQSPSHSMSLGKPVLDQDLP